MSKGLFAGRYELDRVLGVGATATVHLARDTQGGTAVAIKILRPELAQSTATGRFLKEIRRTAQLDHPHIVKVLDSGEFDSKPYFVLPYMEGGTLRAKLQQESQLTFEETIAILRPIAQALDYAHAQGLIHRDVKPENILFTGGQACLGDFGIARAIETTFGTDGTTSSDTIRGTYAYMSPEQAAGGKNLDGRSDIYSLACVAYEMITGMQAFIGPTPEVVVAQRFNFTPREVRAFRPSAPRDLDGALGKAFAMSPADRYRSASEFIEALAIAAAGQASSALAQRPGTGPRDRARVAAVAAVLFAVIAVSAALIAPSVQAWRSDAGEVDTTRVVLLPLERDSAAVPPWRDDDLLWQGLARWRHVALVDQFQVADAIRRRGQVQTHEHAAALAKSLGAGRYIRGRVTGFGQNWHVFASLYDPRVSAPLHQKSVEVPNDIQGASAAYARLADSLLLRGAAADSIPVTQSGTRSLPAVQAFGVAMAALADWDLIRSDRALDTALSYDPQYARASLWQAQVRSWRGLSPNEWGTPAERAGLMSSQLTERERGLASALIHLSKGSYQRACAVYENLISRNGHDFAAWFGLGECEMKNRLVIRDTLSPSGWRFASSANRGMRAYRRAFEILPSVYRGYQHGAFERLRGLLLLSTHVVSGLGANDSAVFRARPAWIGDSLVLVPYPDSIMAAQGPVPPGMQHAIARQREEFRALAANWSAAFPTSPGVKEAVAVALELLGDVTAIDTLRTARSLSTGLSDRIRLAATEALLLVRFGTPDRIDFLRTAAALADSVLAANAQPSPEDARRLAPLAVLLGRCDVADSLIVRGGSGVTLRRFSEALYAQSQMLLVRGTLECAPPRTGPLGQLATTIDREAAVRRADARTADGALLMRPAITITPYDTTVLVRLSRSAGHPLVSAALHAGRGQRANASATLRGVEADWAREPGTPDFVLAAAKARLAIGDTALAVRDLEVMLNGARAYGPEVLDELGTAAAFVAGASLRADLARAAGDTTALRRWSALPRALWALADKPLRQRAHDNAELSRRR